MKKICYVISLLLFFVVFTSCNNDEPGDTSAVVGTWYGDDYDNFYSNVTITFKSDGTGSATIDHYGALTSIRRGEFTYKVKGKTVTTKGFLGKANSDGEADTQDFNNKYEIQGNKLIVVSGSNWYTNSVKSYKKE